MMKNSQLSEALAFSGSTLTSVLILEKKFLCLNVGDSRIIRGRFNKSASKWTYQ